MRHVAGQLKMVQRPFLQGWKEVKRRDVPVSPVGKQKGILWLGLANGQKRAASDPVERKANPRLECPVSGK